MGSAPCPFNETMCGIGDDAVSVDSGPVDVTKAFGLNLGNKDHIQFRKKTVCTVLPIDGYYDVIPLKLMPTWAPTGRDIYPGEEVVAIFYGPTSDFTTGESYYGNLLESNMSANPDVLP
jgi:hypothetical protein